MPMRHIKPCSELIGVFVTLHVAAAGSRNNKTVENHHPGTHVAITVATLTAMLHSAAGGMFGP
jgi:hypothetical protein